MTLLFALCMALQEKPAPTTLDLKVRAQGDPVLGRKSVPVEELTGQLKVLVDKGLATVILRIDSLCTFQQIQRTVSSCKTAGVPKIEVSSKKFPPTLPFSYAEKPSIRIRIFPGPRGEETHLEVKSEITKLADLPVQLKRLGTIPIQLAPAANIPYKTLRKVIITCVEAGLRNLSFAPPKRKSEAIQVLYLEDRARKEFRAIYQTLVGSKKIDVDVRLIESPPGTPEFLDAFPRDLVDYNVVLVGEFRSFEEGDREELRRFVLNQGGGIVWLAPDRHPTGWPGHDMPQITPLEISAVRGPATPFPTPISLVVQDTKSPLVQNLNWDHLSRKVHFPWKPGKIDPDAMIPVTSQWSNTPDQNAFLVLQDVGRGRSVFVGAEDTWRWGGDMKTFWENVFTWAAHREKKASD